MAQGPSRSSFFPRADPTNNNRYSFSFQVSNRKNIVPTCPLIFSLVFLLICSLSLLLFLFSITFPFARSLSSRFPLVYSPYPDIYYAYPANYTQGQPYQPGRICDKSRACRLPQTGARPKGSISCTFMHLALEIPPHKKKRFRSLLARRIEAKRAPNHKGKRSCKAVT